MSGRISLPIAVALAALTAQGCGNKGTNSSSACHSTFDCAAGETCVMAEDAATGYCTPSDVTSQLQVYLEFQSSTESLPAIQFGPIQLSNGVNQSLVLPEPINVAGSVQSGIVGTDIPGTKVLFTAQSGIPGRTQQFNQTTDGNAAFQFTLPQGTYSLVATPPPGLSQAPQPPQYVGDVSTSAIPDPFVLNLTAATSTISGAILLADPAFNFNNLSLLVSAIDAAPQYNAPGDVPRGLATPATTNGNGGFSMLISPTPVGQTPDPVQLQISSTPGGDAFPSFDDAVSPIQLGSASSSATVTVPTLDVSATPAIVSGKILRPDGSAASLATVYVTTEAGKLGVMPPFAYSTSTTTDSTGAFTVSLFATYSGAPVTYSIVAQPSFALTDVAETTPALCGLNSSAAVSVSKQNTTVSVPTIVCDTRTQITGSIETSTGAAAAGAEITATLQPTAAYPISLSFQTQTQGDGSFAMALPAGTYSLAITPAAGSGQPAYVSPTAYTLTAGKPATWDIRLFEPFNLAGKIFLGKTGQPFTGTFTAYLSNGTTATAIGQGIAATDGSYAILLPNVGQ